MSVGVSFDVGALLGAGISTAGQLYANQQNIQNQNRLFSEQVNLANSAHQREVNDLRLAGLNPILSAQGSGADAPTPQAVSQQNPLEAWSAASSIVAQQKQADAAETNAQSNVWQIFNAQDLGLAEFGFRFFGLKTGGKVKVGTTKAIRVNKITGEVYDVMTGKRITDLNAISANSGKRVPNGEVTVKYEGFPKESDRGSAVRRPLNDNFRNPTGGGFLW